MAIEDITVGRRALDIAYGLSKPLKEDCSSVTVWMDKSIVATLEGYAKALGMTYSDLYRGIIIAGMPNDDDVQGKIQDDGVKSQFPYSRSPARLSGER